MNHKGEREASNVSLRSSDIEQITLWPSKTFQQSYTAKNIVFDKIHQSHIVSFSIFLFFVPSIDLIENS